MPVVIVALVVLSRFEPISYFLWFFDGCILPGSVDLNTRPFSNSAGDGILELRGVVRKCQ